VGAVADRVASSEFTRRYDLPDWRILLRGVEGWFAASSFSAGAAFVAEVAQAADEADHHPDVDLRYPGRVHVRLISHDVTGLSDRDAALAERISELARERGLAAEPRASTRTEVAIDALDIELVRPFWTAVLGYRDETPHEPGDIVRAIRDPAGLGPSFWFQQMDEPRPQRNRIHIDVTVPEDEVDARIEAALAAGGTLVSDAEARAFWVLADPEGNEACLCTWQDRD
jgi:4a-hydroxytetrahydrobiopterin dehydratase